MTVKTLIAVTKTTRRKTTMHSSISFILSYLNLNRNQKKGFFKSVSCKTGFFHPNTYPNPNPSLNPNPKAYPNPNPKPIPKPKLTITLTLTLYLTLIHYIIYIHIAYE